MTLTFSLSVGYQRRRPSTIDKLEQRMDSLGLFLIGSAATLLILFFVLPKLIEWITHL